MANDARLARMERGFSPRNIAVIGAARHNNFGWLRRHLPFQERGLGKIFHINIDTNEWPGGEALGAKAYESVLDVQEPIDYVTVSVPPHVAGRVLADCIKKDVAVVHFFTAGFSDAGTEEGLRLESAIADMLVGSNTLLMGPNCMGLYNPAVGLRQMEDADVGEGGELGYISQSGSQSIGFVSAMAAHGMRMSKSFSMGNGLDLDAPDYLDYLARDDATRAIGLYVEGVKDTSRFFRSVRDASQRKPVLVWKVGLTPDAARATEAHTGSRFIPEDLWDSLLRSSGGIRIDSLDEMLNTTKLMLRVPPSFGYRAGLVAVSGGHATEMANAFSKSGFEVPPLTRKTYDEFSTFFDVVGGSFRNPVEGTAFRDSMVFKRSLRLLVDDENIDIVAVEISAGRIARPSGQLDARIEAIREIHAVSKKPIVAVLTTTLPYSISMDETVLQRLAAAGIGACHGFEMSAKTLKKLVDFHLVRSYLAP